MDKFFTSLSHCVWGTRQLNLWLKAWSSKSCFEQAGNSLPRCQKGVPLYANTASTEHRCWFSAAPSTWGLPHDLCLVLRACAQSNQDHYPDESTPRMEQEEVWRLLRRVCSQHGQALLALNIYDWMRTPAAQGGAGLRPTVFTYTAAMRAALAGNLIDRALKVAMHSVHQMYCGVRTPCHGRWNSASMMLRLVCNDNDGAS